MGGEERDRLREHVAHERLQDRKHLRAGLLLDAKFDDRHNQSLRYEDMPIRDPGLQQALAASSDDRDRQLERDMAAALALSADSAPLPNFDDDEVRQALLTSLQEEEDRQRRLDDPELWQAALRASRMDLGPRGISQPAKILAGELSLGQQLRKSSAASSSAGVDMGIASAGHSAYAVAGTENDHYTASSSKFGEHCHKPLNSASRTSSSSDSTAGIENDHSTAASSKFGEHCHKPPNSASRPSSSSVASGTSTTPLPSAHRQSFQASSQAQSQSSNARPLRSGAHHVSSTPRSSLSSAGSALAGSKASGGTILPKHAKAC